MPDPDSPPSPLLLDGDGEGVRASASAIRATVAALPADGGDLGATIAAAVEIGARRPQGVLATWELLAAVAARDVAMARVLEPHLDALGILEEARAAGIDVDLDAVGAGPASSWGVFAAEGPGVRLDAADTAEGWVLTGTKPWCSLAAELSHALVTAWVGSGERRLFAVSLRGPGVTARPGPWHSRGLSEIVSAPVDFEGVRAVPVGEAGWYLRRPGFAHGGVGVAACWWGGAFPLRAALLAAAAAERADQLALMHLGRADTALWAARAALREAADVFDGAHRTARERSVAADDDDAALQKHVAARARTVVAGAVETVLTAAAHALGPLPLVADEEHARRVADLQIYVRQHHAERDLARVGADVVTAGGAW